MKRLGLALVTSVVLAMFGAAAVAERTALACGFWYLEDLEAGKQIAFFMNYVERRALPQKGAKAQKGATIMYLYGDSVERLVVTQGKRTLFSVDKDNRVMAGKRAIGTLDGSAVDIGGQRYAIAVSPHQPEEKGSPYRWSVEVKRGDELVGRGIAMALCLDAHMKRKLSANAQDAALQASLDDEEKREVVKRVVYYLAWRDEKDGKNKSKGAGATRQ